MKKRERGEDDGGPPQPVKRAAGPRGGEPSENHHAAAANGQRLTTDDALTYLKDVKEKFKDDKEKYNEFLEVMKDFKAQRVDTAGVITRVKELFKGHRNLILGFNTFLPRGYEITLPLEAEDKKVQPAVEFDQAINYVNKIKARFQTDEHVYKAFLEILNMYRKGNKTINEVYQEVALLFENHGDLLEEFTYFLPGSTGPPITHAHPIAKPVQQPPPRHREDSKPFVKHPNERLLIPKREKSSIMQGERSRDRDPERRSEKDRKKSDKEKERKDNGDRKDGGEREEGGRDKERDFVEQKPKRASARNASDAIRRQSQVGEGGEGFSGPSPQASTDDKKAMKGASAVQLAFFDKVKVRLRSREVYQEFLKCLNIFSQEIISREELQSLVSDILGKHADLLEGFNEFLTHCENVEGYLAGVMNARKLGADFTEGAPLKAVKLGRDDRNRDREREREKEREREREREKEKEKEKDRELAVRERDVKPTKDGGHKVASVPKDKFMNKPISELDLSNCERCTPSYRLLPKHYPRPASSYRTTLGNSVLNDCWVSVTSGSEDYSFKHMRKNQYEESLYRCEDDRFELDMLLETTRLTAQLVGEYTAKQETEKVMPPVDEYLSAINLRCIERIYGDHGLDILDLLRKNTSVAMPVIHTRLLQKTDEWTKCREEMNKVWAEVYMKNVFKALDHRSFHFKQHDKKALSTKGLLADIKEANEKRRREDDTMLVIAAGNRRAMLPDLRFEFSDPSIHEHMYGIIKYSSEEISSSPDHTEKIMRMWETFLEPMMGISLRAHGAEDMEEAVKVKAVVEGGGGSEGDETSSGEGGGSGIEREGAATRGTNGDGVRAAAVADCVVAENADTGVSEHSSDGAHEASVRGLASGAAESAAARTEGTAARTEGSGWFHAENSGARQGGRIGTEAKSKAGLGGSRSALAIGADHAMDGNNLPAGGGTVDREEGELSPYSEQEERIKVKYNPGGDAGENKTLKMFDQEDEDAEVVGGTEMEHDQDADDEGEESVPKTSEDSDNGSEAGEEVSASERSGDEHSEHEEEEDDDEEQEGKAESEGEAEGMADVEDGNGDGNSSLDCSYAHCMPLTAHAPSAEVAVADRDARKPGRIFYGNDMFYVLFRLHQKLYERILSAKVNSEIAAKNKSNDGGEVPNVYSKFLELLYGLLDGSIDNLKYEDECRALIGTQSFVLFTLDKLIFKLVKQLQAAASDEVAIRLLALNAYENGGECGDLVYHANACVILHDENIYRFEHKSNPSELLIQLMEGGCVKHEGGHALESSFQKYLDEFFLSTPTRREQKHKIFLTRNKKKKMVAGKDEDSALQEAMENVRVVNGLEHKISCHTFKVSYVLDTEDLFFRSKAGRADKQKAANREAEKQRRLRDYLEGVLHIPHDNESLLSGTSPMEL